MEIILDLDEPKTKFSIGDVINILGELGFSIFGLVSRIIYVGTFTSCRQCGKSFGSISDVKYEIVVQQNSRDLDCGCLIRPGQRKLMTTSQLEQYEKIDFQYELVDGDTKETFHQRQNQWRKMAGKNGR